VRKEKEENRQKRKEKRENKNKNKNKNKKRGANLLRNPLVVLSARVRIIRPQ
jgi:hypothetical protein